MALGQKLKGFTEAANVCNLLTVVAFQFTWISASHDSVGMGWMILLAAFYNALMPWSALAWAGLLGIVAGLWWRTVAGACLQLLGAAAFLASAIGAGVPRFCFYFYLPCALALALNLLVLSVRLAARARSVVPGAMP